MEPMVLVVDDESSVRSLISNSLRDHGYRTVEAADGVDALRKARELRPDAVVLDIELPALDGTTILQSLRSHPDTQLVPIIGMSGYEIDPADERSFTCFLQKPFSPSDVVFVLAQVAPLAGSGR
ncbi:MAG TPA: response regulator [Longimicrobiales bacterium]|nr:response regulator [Longimicrobiales bacterium]